MGVTEREIKKAAYFDVAFHWTSGAELTLVGAPRILLSHVCLITIIAHMFDLGCDRSK
jgi:hypothetical protein